MKSYLFWGVIFFLSRIPFINSGPVFFDSGEYLQRFSNPSLYLALVMGHVPLHAGYILPFWPVWQLLGSIFNPANIIVILQIILAYLGIVAFYNVIREIASVRIAFFASLFISLTPLFWISNVTIMMETVYVASFFISLFLFILYIRHRSIVFLILGCLVLFVSLLTHLAPLLWMPMYLLLLLMVSRKYRLPFVFAGTMYLLIGVTLGGFSITNAYLLDLKSLADGLKELYLGKTQEASGFDFNAVGVGRYVRNWLMPFLRNCTSILFILGIIGFTMQWKKNKRYFTLGLFWLLPSLVVNQWSDSLWFGRHALISYFGIACMGAVWIEKKENLLITIVLLYMLVATIPALVLLRKEIPYVVLSDGVKKLPLESLYIESHYARPFIESVGKTNTYFVNEPRDQGDVSMRIYAALEKNIPVFVSSQALSDPYGLYAGPYLHIRTLSYKNDPVLKKVLVGNYKLIEHETFSREDNLVIYQLVSSSYTFVYPDITRLVNSKRRIDYYDPIIQIWLFLKKTVQ